MAQFIKAEVGLNHAIIYTDNEQRYFRYSGGTWAWRNHNPGNLVPGKISARHNQIGSIGKFAIFPDDESGHSLASEFGIYLLRGATPHVASSKIQISSRPLGVHFGVHSRSLTQMKAAIPHKVEVVPYDIHWPNLFKNEANRIQKALGACLKEIYHIGSTSIPDMPAKPAIDMMLVLDNVDDIHAISEKLTQLNYDPIRRQIIPHVSFFTKRQDQTIRFHLHLHERGSPQINRHVNFRDYVIHHPKVADDYAKLKIQLVTQFADDIYSYVSGKDKLVQEIDTKAKLWSEKKRGYLPQNTGPLAKDWPHEKLVKAMEANLNVHMTNFSQYLRQVELIRVPGFTLVNSGLADDTFNYAIDADFSSVNANKKISEVTDYFTQKNIPFSWWIGPHDQPDDLPAHLENHGYKNTENNCAMYFDLDAWDGQIFSIPKLNIIRATDEKTLHDFALVLANDKAAFKTYFSWVASILTDDDPIEYYVGYVDGKPVVRGLSCYFAQVAGLHWLSTVPSERRKGYGRAMQEYRLKRAKDLGYHIAVLQASSEGYPLYQQLGYQECGNFREYKKIK